MEPVSTAIIAALVAGVATGTTKVVEQTAVDAYNALMTVLRKKIGSNSDVIGAVELLEKKPDAETRQAVVTEAIKDAKAHEDADLITAAKNLLAELEKTATGQQTVAKYHVTAENIAQVGNGNYFYGDVRSGGNK